jgi:hypothetical protein
VANFFVPPGEDPNLYGMTTKAEGSGSSEEFLHPWKITVTPNAVGVIGLYAGYDKDRNPLQLESNNPGVIDIWDKSPPSWPGDRLIHISGLKVDFTVLDAREKRGLKYCSILWHRRPVN